MGLIPALSLLFFLRLCKRHSWIRTHNLEAGTAPRFPFSCHHATEVVWLERSSGRIYLSRFLIAPLVEERKTGSSS